jgi:hypothetical protein
MLQCNSLQTSWPCFRRIYLAVEGLSLVGLGVQGPCPGAGKSELNFQGTVLFRVFARTE